MNQSQIEFCKKRFKEEYEHLLGSVADDIQEKYDDSKNEFSVKNTKLELVWRKYEHAEALCRGLPIYGIKFDDPMTSQEYFLVEINQYNDTGERSARYFPHYSFMNYMHLIPHLIPFIKKK